MDALLPTASNDYVVAAVLGLSFGNLWLCALLVFSLQTSNRRTATGYLLGRFVAILLLSLIVATAGKLVVIERDILNLVSGALLVVFAGWLAATRLWGWVPFWRQVGRTEGTDVHQHCDGECDTCPAHAHSAYASACDSCDDKGLCDAEEPEVEALTRAARMSWSRQVPDDRPSGLLAGVSLGAVRGAAMCTKLIVLVPILLTASLPKAAGLGLTFSVTSSIYPLIGFAFGAVALKLVRYKRALVAVAVALLLVAGVTYLWDGATGAAAPLLAATAQPT